MDRWALGLRALVLLGSLGACGVPDAIAPGVEALAPAERASLEPLLERWSASGSGLGFSPDDQGTGAWVEVDLDPDGWRAARGAWEHDWPGPWTNEPRDRLRLVLDGPGDRVRVIELPGLGELPRARRVESTIRLELEPGERPDAVRLGLWLERGPDGYLAANHGGIGRLERGFPLWPGERVELAVDVPAGSVLRFFPRLRPLGPSTRVRFRVALEGREIFARAYSAEAPPDAGPVVLALDGAPRHARLAFEVEGDPAACGVGQPRIAPAEVGRPDARPWGAARPDVVLFVADTFRADLMAAFGGAPGLTPALDALAARAVVFPAARSASTWTLPAHASLFTGLWPPQHGAVSTDQALAADYETLAERFTAAGYRTAAVTDGLYVARRHGLAQGFEGFDSLRHLEGEPRLPRTLARARAVLDDDDGRPLFLFVHTYRTHWPYAAGPDENGQEALALRREAARAARGTADPAERLRRLAPLAEAMHALYRGGARSLDAAIGPWFAELEAAGRLRNAWFVFTSDHGEAFLEHGVSTHATDAHEEQARVPLFLLGPAAAPRRVPYGASLVDLAPTLARLCSLAPAADWVGQDLLTLDHERMLLACTRVEGDQLVTVTEGVHKLLARAPERVRLPGDEFAAYALDRDPSERVSLLEDAAWPRDLAARAGADLARLRLVHAAATADLDQSLREELARLGYAR